MDIVDIHVHATVYLYIQKKQRERRSHCIKKNGNGVPVRSSATRTLGAGRGVAYSVNCTPAFVDMRLADALI